MSMTPGELIELANQLLIVAGRIPGVITVTGPPANTLGAEGASAFWAEERTWYGPKTAAGWPPGVVVTRGPEGLSAKQIVINAGLLPPGATDAQFATWLADAQIAKVQPLVDAAGVSAASAASDADAAQTAATAAGDARTGAEAAQAAVAGAADATAADRLATGADRAAVAGDRTAVEAAALAAARHADDAEAAAGASAAAKGLAEDAADASAASATTASDDADATAADRLAVASDRAAVAADRTASEAAAGTATTKAGEASGSADDAVAARVAAEAAQAAAEQARDEAEAIAGGDFVTGPTASTDGRLAVFAGLNGKVIKEGPAFGVSEPGDVLRRSDGDARYAVSDDTYTKQQVDAAIKGAPFQAAPYQKAATNLALVKTGALASALGAVRANAADASVLFIGDSITFGAYAGDPDSPTPNAHANAFPAQLAAWLNDKVPTSIRARAGDGDAGVALIDISDPTISIGGWAVGPGATIGGKYFTAAADGAAMTIDNPEPWDSFELIYLRAANGEALNVGAVTVAGPTGETASVDAKAGVGTGVARLVLSRSTAASGTVTLTAGLDAGESFYVVGWLFRNSERRVMHFVNAGIRAANTGTSNATPLGLTRSTGNAFVMRDAIAGVWKPALTFIMAGTNDARIGGLNPGVTAFKANVQLLINDAARSGAVVLLIPPDFSPASEGPVAWSEYRSALHDLAAANSLTLIDFQKVLGPYAQSVANGTQKDDLHPNADGHALMAQALQQVMTQALTGPTYATAAEVRAGAIRGAAVPPRAMADALATVSIPPATAAAGLNFGGFINAEIILAGDLTVGPPSGGFGRKTGEIDLVQDATGGRTVDFHADFIVPANFNLQTTPNGRTSVPYRCEVNGKVRLYNPSTWSA